MPNLPPPIQDLISQVDFTVQPASGAILNQGLATLQGSLAGDNLSAIGLVIWTVDNSLGVPNVPNPALPITPKWKHYGWLRIPFTGATDKTGTLYTWNDDAPNDATFLKWTSTKVDLTVLTADVVALQTAVVAAQNSANNAQSTASAATTTANAANTTANNANITAAAAQTAANTANTNASAAVTTANQASTDAASAIASAATATTTANTASATSATALATANQALNLTREFKYTVAGSYNWLCPPGVTTVYVTCLGAGGGGGVRGVGDASGGGGGELSFLKAFTVTPGNIYPIQVGAKGVGVGGAGGSNGTNSFFNDASTCNANGGFGGGFQIGPAANGGGGGVGTTVISGLVAHMTNEGSVFNGFGGNSLLDGLGGTCNTAVSQNGPAATGNGAGGGTATGGGNTGGNGGDGMVIIRC